jgi:hypothetical protein
MPVPTRDILIVQRKMSVSTAAKTRLEHFILNAKPPAKPAVWVVF